MGVSTTGVFGGLYIKKRKVICEPVGDHVKITVRGTLYWGGAVPPPFVFPIWVRAYYKGVEMDRWEGLYNPLQHPGPFYFTVDKMYDIPNGEKIKIVAGYSYLKWEFVTDEKEVVVDYFSPYIKSCTFDVVSTYEGILRIDLASRYSPHTDRVVTVNIGRDAERVWYKDLIWPAGESERSIELVCSKEKLPGYVYLPEGRYWIRLVYKGLSYDFKFVDISYEYKTFWQRVMEWFYAHSYELLGLALLLIFASAIIVKWRRSR